MKKVVSRAVTAINRPMKRFHMKIRMASRSMIPTLTMSSVRRVYFTAMNSATGSKRIQYCKGVISSYRKSKKCVRSSTMA